MPTDLYLRLLAIFAIVALGYAAGRARWVGEGDVARVMSNAAFVLFMPALLFRTTARIDFATLQAATLAVFFVPTLVLVFGTYLWERRRASSSAAAPSVRATSAAFGNTVQLGIPIAAALFGEGGLALHVAIVSLHALIILTAVTALVEHDLARERSREAGLPHRMRDTLVSTVRNTVIHPVVLPVIAGLLWNLLGAPLPATVDEVLKLLAQAAVPLCLVIIGLSFGGNGLRSLRFAGGPAIAISAAKLVLLPVLVLALGRYGFGFDGTTLAVVVMCAALPVGANALIFAQRYDAKVAETTVSIVLSTLAFVFTAPLWLLLLGWLSRP
jgi:malonate transporter